MCISPRTFEIERDERFEEITVSCGECWQCRLTKVNDYVGRCLAEAYVSDHTAAVTLTYADGHAGSPEKWLHKEHFPKFIRALRDRHHRLRYLCVSERGSKGTERLHFHALLFFRGPRPDWKQGGRSWDKAWPWGHMNVDWTADDRALRYTLKYVLKNADQGSYWKTSSLKPALGHDWLMAKADLAISQGVMPTSFLYLPPNSRHGIRYRMSGATRRNYISRVAEGLRMQGRCPWSISDEILQKAVDHADRWAMDKEQREKLALMTDDQREEYVSEQIQHIRKGLPVMTDVQAERYLNALQIQMCLGAADDFDTMALDMQRNRAAWSEPYNVEF